MILSVTQGAPQCLTVPQRMLLVSVSVYMPVSVHICNPVPDIVPVSKPEGAIAYSTIATDGATVPISVPLFVPVIIIEAEKFWFWFQ